RVGSAWGAGARLHRPHQTHTDSPPPPLSLAGAPATRRSEFAGRDLPGKDLGPVLSSPTAAGVHSARASVLFAYSSLLCNDSGLIKVSGEAIAEGRDAKESLKSSGYKPDLKKRGSLRTVFDGRYKFSRYFGPVDRNCP